MQKTVYEDYKYSMQDAGSLYIGSKYTLNEIIENEEITFKFRLIVERYILPEADLEDTLEAHLYYLDSKSRLIKIYKQLKGRVKVCIYGKSKSQYETKIFKAENLAAMSVEEKREKGLIVQELILSKLALMTF